MPSDVRLNSWLLKRVTEELNVKRVRQQTRNCVSGKIEDFEPKTISFKPIHPGLSTTPAVLG